MTEVKISDYNEIVHSTALTDLHSKVLVLKTEAVKQILPMPDHGEPKETFAAALIIDHSSHSSIW